MSARLMWRGSPKSSLTPTLIFKQLPAENLCTMAAASIAESSERESHFLFIAVLSDLKELWCWLLRLVQNLGCSYPRRMARDELPAPVAPNKNIREATLAGHGLTLNESFGGDATSDHGGLLVQTHIHIVHVVARQLHVGIRWLLQAFKV